MLYYADAACLREIGHSMSGSEYIKYEHGPVPSRGEKSIKTLRAENLLIRRRGRPRSQMGTIKRNIPASVQV